jgi:hypothetical protein
VRSVYRCRPVPRRVCCPRASALNSAAERSSRRRGQRTARFWRSCHRARVRLIRLPRSSREQVGRQNQFGCPVPGASRRRTDRAAAWSPRPARGRPPPRRCSKSWRRTVCQPQPWDHSPVSHLACSMRGPVSSDCPRGRSPVSRPPCSSSRRCSSTRPDRCPGWQVLVRGLRLAARWGLDRGCPRPRRTRIGPYPTARHSAAAPWRCARWAQPMRPGYVPRRHRGVRRLRRRRPVRRCPAPDSSRRSGRTRTPLVKAELFELDGQPNGRGPTRSGISPRPAERTPSRPRFVLGPAPGGRSRLSSKPSCRAQ